MANRQRGEVELAIPGGPTYTLVLNTHGMASIETHLAAAEGRDVPWADFLTRLLELGRVSDALLLIWGMSRRHHPELTLADVGAIVDDVGGITAIRALISAAREAATPATADVAALGTAARGRPRKAQTTATAGGGSTSRRARSA